MSLAINTPKGKVHAEQQREAARIVFGSGPKRFVHTETKGDNGGAFVDGIIFDESDTIVGVAEIKSRPTMTQRQLMNEFRGEWLITLNKVGFLCSASVIFCVPGYGMLYLPTDGVVLMVKICEPSGMYCCDIRHEVTQTQATCNGGVAVRDNAFIQMKGSKIFRH